MAEWLVMMIRPEADGVRQSGRVIRVVLLVLQSQLVELDGQRHQTRLRTQIRRPDQDGEEFQARAGLLTVVMLFAQLLDVVEQLGEELSAMVRQL